MANDLPTPVTNPEKFAAKAAGMDIETPTPITPMEKYLDAIAKRGGGGTVDAYTKDETNTLLAAKADKSTTKTAWTGTAAQYAQLVSDEYDLYFIEEVVSP